ncbi:hypothetical protein FA95DRAFT_1613049 [Auriscalpium vulgare]|uniref:Uncharacterized protein n=1 Tax=Auriscalpium vulgare TaxID=40419 RepID=A0ACB8R527_9AGAM|nr:hypothetical protein FA95DRAFT_1613049 [Auriscalpium vulgare]
MDSSCEKEVAIREWVNSTIRRVRAETHHIYHPNIPLAAAYWPAMNLALRPPTPDHARNPTVGDVITPPSYPTARSSPSSSSPNSLPTLPFLLNLKPFSQIDGEVPRTDVDEAIEQYGRKEDHDGTDIEAGVVDFYKNARQKHADRASMGDDAEYSPERSGYTHSRAPSYRGHSHRKAFGRSSTVDSPTVVAAQRRTTLESDRVRTILLLHQALVERMPTADSTLSEHRLFVHCIPPLPSKWAFLTPRFFSSGVVKSAQEIFERLETQKGGTRLLQTVEYLPEATSISRHVAYDALREAKLWCLPAELEQDEAVERFQLVASQGFGMKAKDLRSLFPGNRH